MTALNLNLQQVLGSFVVGAGGLLNLSTSGSFSFSVTQMQVIRAMMIDIGALDPNENPTALEYNDCSLKLNTMVKEWMGKQDLAPGMKVWTRRRADLFLGYSKFAYNVGPTGDNWVESTTGLAYPTSYGSTTLGASAALGATVLTMTSVAQMNILDYIGIVVGNDIFWTTITAINVGLNQVTVATGLSGAASGGAYVWNYTVKAQRPLNILTCSLRDIYSNDIDMRLMTVERYESLPTKTAPTNISDPTAILYESQFKVQTPNGILYLDVAGAQDITKHLHCVYLCPVQDMVNPGDMLDYPQQWFGALIAGLGKRCAPMFECDWDQTDEDNLIASMTAAREADPEVSDVYFEVNTTSPYEN